MSPIVRRGAPIAIALLCCLSLAAHSAPIQPILRDSTLVEGNYNSARTSSMWKNTVYISGWPDGCYDPLFVMDVTNPKDTISVTRVGPDGCYYNESITVNDILYVAGWFGGLRIYNVSNPISPVLLSVYEIPGVAFWGIDVAKDRVYITEDTETTCAIHTFDVSNPSNPVHLSRMEEGLLDSIGGIAVRGSYMYIGHSHHSMTIPEYRFAVADISDDRNPRIIWQTQMEHPVGQIRIRGNYAYLACNGIYVYDISDPRSPRYVANWEGATGGFILLGDFAFLATGGNGVVMLNIANPNNMYAFAQPNVDCEFEQAISGQGRYIHVGTGRNHGTACGEYTDPDKLLTYECFTQDPDDAGPGNWSSFTPADASWDLQYEADNLPSSGSNSWIVLEGTEQWCSVSDGILRINDTGTQPGNKIKYSRIWNATNFRGSTVLVRARCDSYSAPGGDMSTLGNIYIEDGRFVEEFIILPDRIRAKYANLEAAVTAGDFHTYRITIKGTEFNVCVDEAAAPAMTGTLTHATNHARIIFGSGSSAGTQDISFDYVYYFSDGVYGPPPLTGDRTPDITVNVADTPGKGSMSGINPSTARVHWSTDGGLTWNSSGGYEWECQYEATALPSVSATSWFIAEPAEVPGGPDRERWASIVSGALRINDTGTQPGEKIKWSREWKASPSVGTTVLARAKCDAIGGDTTYVGNIYIEDGANQVSFRITPTSIDCLETGASYPLAGSTYHIYRFTTKNGQFSVYVDEAPTPVLTGSMSTPTSNNRIMFGSGGSAGTQSIYFDYLRYTSEGDLPPGRRNGGGPVPVYFLKANPLDRNIVDRGTIRASSIPFNQFSETLNKVRFSIRDQEGNLGLSPIYTVRIVDHSIAAAKKMPDGTQVVLGDKVLYYLRSSVGYIEESDRSAGIRLEGGIVQAVGKLVCVTGAVRTTPGGERYIQVESILVNTPASVGPLGMSVRSLKESMVTGLFVRAWGQVTSVGANDFVINDGSDGAGIRVITYNAPGVSVGDFVAVDGAAGFEGERVMYRR